MYWEYVRQLASNSNVTADLHQIPANLEYVPGKPQHMFPPQSGVSDEVPMSPSNSLAQVPTQLMTQHPHPYYVGQYIFLNPYFYYPYSNSFYLYP